MESELIIDQQGGAVTVKFSDMSDQELRRRMWVFPEALAEATKRFLKERSASSR